MLTSSHNHHERNNNSKDDQQLSRKRKYEAIAINQTLRACDEERNIKIKMNDNNNKNNEYLDDSAQGIAVQINFKSNSGTKFTMKINDSNDGGKNIIIETTKVIQKSYITSKNLSNQDYSITNEVEILSANENDKRSGVEILLNSNTIKDIEVNDGYTRNDNHLKSPKNSCTKENNECIHRYNKTPSTISKSKSLCDTHNANTICKTQSKSIQLKVKTPPYEISDFKKIVEGGYFYIDKTNIIAKLLNHPFLRSELYLSRPKGFGKTLLISTLRYLFSGKYKHLFEKLHIWKCTQLFEDIGNGYPILDFNFAEITDNNIENSQKAADFLENNLKVQIIKKAQEYGIELRNSLKPSEMIKILITELGKKTQRNVVILIDNCDTPLINFIDDEDDFNIVNEVLLPIHLAIKEASNNRLIKFLLMTGNIEPYDSIYDFESFRDRVTLEPELHDLCGFTSTDISGYLDNYINHLSITSGRNSQEIKYNIQKRFPLFKFSHSHGKINTNNLIPPEMLFNYFNYIQKSNIENIHETLTLLDISLLTRIFRSVSLRFLKPIITEEVSLFFLTRFEHINNKNGFFKILFQFGVLTLDTQRKSQACDSVWLKFPNYEIKKITCEILTKMLIDKTIESEETDILLQYLVDEKFNEYFDTLHAKILKIPHNMIPNDSSEKEAYIEAIFALMNVNGIGDDNKLVQAFKVKSCNSSDHKMILDLLIEHPSTKKVFMFKLRNGANVSDSIASISSSDIFEGYENNSGFEKLFIIELNFNALKNNFDKLAISEFVKNGEKLVLMS